MADSSGSDSPQRTNYSGTGKGVVMGKEKSMNGNIGPQGGHGNHMVGRQYAGPQTPGQTAQTTLFPFTMDGQRLGVRLQPHVQAEQQGADLAKRLTATTAAELRAVPADKLQTATAFVIPADGRVTARPPRYAPNLDGVVVPVDPGAAGARVASKVPFLTGYNHDESAISPTDRATAAAARNT